MKDDVEEGIIMKTETRWLALKFKIWLLFGKKNNIICEIQAKACCYNVFRDNMRVDRQEPQE